MSALLSYFGIELNGNATEKEFKPTALTLDDSHPPPEIVDVSMDDINTIKPLFTTRAWKMLLEKSKLSIKFISDLKPGFI